MFAHIQPMGGATEDCIRAQDVLRKATVAPELLADARTLLGDLTAAARGGRSRHHREGRSRSDARRASPERGGAAAGRGSGGAAAASSGGRRYGTRRRPLRSPSGAPAPPAHSKAAGASRPVPPEPAPQALPDA